VDEDGDRGSAAELLADWRSAGRDTAAAKAAVRVASLALDAAQAAQDAASETETAARAAQDAVERAMQAAGSAKRAAAHAAEAAKILMSTAEGDQVRANNDLGEARLSEQEAGDRFHDAQDLGFPTDPG
jgi:hypothetical protein